MCACRQCALRTTAALQDREGEREYAARQNIYDAPEHKGEAQIRNGFNCEVSPGCLESSALPVEFSYNVLFSVHIFEALEKSGSCRETKKCLFNILYKKVHKNVLLLIYLTIVILQNVVKQNKKGINGRRQ